MSVDTRRAAIMLEAEPKDHTLVSAPVRESVAKGSVLYELRPVLQSDGQPAAGCLVLSITPTEP